MECENGILRLIGGTKPSQGRVELCQNNIWRTVCDDKWDDVDAGVVCYELEYAREGKLLINKNYKYTIIEFTILHLLYFNNIVKFVSLKRNEVV